MSYKNRILSDLPLGYWRLNEIVSFGYDDNKTNYNDITVLYNQTESSKIPDETLQYNGYVLGGSFASLLNVAPINTSLSNESYFNGARITSNTKMFIDNNYNFFNKGYENKTFGIEFWALIEDNISSKISLFKGVDDNNNNVCEIYLIEDTIYYTIYGIDYFKSIDVSFTTKKQLTSFDQKFHVFALYQDGNIKIMVNGMSDETITVSNGFIFGTSENIEIDFNIGPAPSGFSFLISDLAFYSRELSINEIRSHMSWASRDNDPKNYAQQGSAYQININNQDNMFVSKKQFSSASDYNKGKFDDGLISDASGITVLKTNSSQPFTGSWYYNFPIAQFQNFAGLDIHWETALPQSSVSSSNYISVYASYDNGNTFYQVENNKSVPFFLSTASDLASSNLLVKITIHSEDSSINIQPRIDNLFIGLYNTVSLSADGGGFIMSPYTSNTYMIKKDDLPFLSRSRNFGINFSSQEPGILNPGKAIISSESLTSYQSIEFWFRYNGSGQSILDFSDNSGVALYIDGLSNSMISNLSGGKVYINSVDQSSGSFTIVEGETYHILVTLPLSQTNSIYINGDQNDTYSPCDATYGFITIFPNSLTNTGVQNRYLSYLSTKVATINDGSTYLGSILEYSGSSTSLNGGLAVIAHDHIF